MTTTRALLGVAALAMFCATSMVNAQGESRDKVKAETKAAMKAGTTPQGEGPAQEPPLKTGKTRADRKAETKSAQARGEMVRGGEASPSEGKASTQGVARKRSDVKAETAQAVKAGKIPSGEK